MKGSSRRVLAGIFILFFAAVAIVAVAKNSDSANNIVITVYKDADFSIPTENITCLKNATCPVYVSVQNTDDKKNDINLAGVFPEFVMVDNIWARNPINVSIPYYSDVCTNVTHANGSFDYGCTRQQNGTQITGQYQWSALGKTQSAAGSRKEHKSSSYAVGKNSTSYFRFDVRMPSGTSGKFDIKTFNEDLSVTILDPFINSSYKAQRNYTSNANAALLNFAFPLNDTAGIDTSAMIATGRLLSNCNDLRVANGTIDVLLDVEIVNCSQANTEVWATANTTSATFNVSFQNNFSSADAPTTASVQGVWNGSYVMVQHLSLNDTTATDSTKNGNNGTITGPIFNTSGRYGGAYYFNGNGSSNISLPDTASLRPATAVTVEFWLYLDGTSQTNNALVSSPQFSNSGNGKGYFLQMFTSGKILAWINDAANGNIAVQTTAAIKTNQWTYIAFTYNKTEVKIYVDGALNNSALSANFADISYQGSTIPGAIGATAVSGISSFSGTIDNLMVSSVAHEANYFLARNGTGGVNKNTFGTEELNVTDTDPPVITIIAPTNATITSTSQALTFTASDANPVTCTRELDGTNTSIASCNNQTLSGLSRGAHTVKVFANDTLNNTAVTSVSFTVDEINPSVAIQNPTNTTNSSVAYLVNFTATDQSTLACWWINSTGQNNSLAGCANTTFTEGADGSKSITVCANDTVGGTTCSNRNWTLDTTKPVVTVNNPTNTTNATSTYLLNFTVAEANPPLTCWYINSTGGNVSLPSCGNTTFTEGADGAKSITVCANDSAEPGGNTGCTNINFTRDTTNPSITISAPTNTTVGSTSQALTILASDTNPITCVRQLDGTNTSIASCGNTTMTALATGAHTVKVFLNDTANNTNVASVSFSVDQTTPTLSISAPTNTTIGSTSQALTFLASDLFLDTCTRELDGTNTTIASCNNQTLSGLATGAHNVKVFVNDTLNNTNVASVSFSVDQTAPSLSISAPTNATIGSTSQALTFTASDSFVDTCTRELDGTNTTIASCNNQTLTGLATGSHNVAVYVNDTVNNTAAARVRFTVDQIAPVVTLLAPTNSTVGNTSVQLIFTAPDNFTDTCVRQLDGTNTTIASCNNQTMTGLATGAHSVKVFANDTTNNTGSASITFTVDQIAPSIAITAPTNTTYNTSNRTLTFTVSDNFTDSCVRELNGANTTIASCGNQTFTATEGANTIKVFANDTINNTAVASVSFTFNSAPSISTVLLTIGNLGTGSAPDANVRIVATDPSGTGDLGFCQGGNATASAFASGVCNINVSDSLFRHFTIEINDTGNNNTAHFTINWTLSNNSYRQDVNSSFTQNLTLQRRVKNDTLTSGSSSTGTWEYQINHSALSNGTLITGYGGSYAANITVAASHTIQSIYSGDWVSEANGTEAQDFANTTDAAIAHYTRFLTNFTNLVSETPWGNVTMTALCRSGWTQNETLINLTASQSVATHSVQCSNTTIITKTRRQYNVTNNASGIANTTLGNDTTAYIELLINNTDTLISWLNVSVNVSQGSLVPSGWTMNDTSQNKTISSLTNATSTTINFSMNRSSALITETSPTAGQCSGFTIFTNYCLQTNITEMTGGVTNFTYTYRALINVTDAFAGPHKVIYYVPVSRLTNWALRTASSENLTTNGTSSNTSLADGDPQLVVLIDNAYNSTAGTSLTTGDAWKVDISYSRTTTVTQSPGGGGGGGGGGTTIIVGPQPNQTLKINPENKEFFIAPGKEETFAYVLRNPNATTQTVRLSFEKSSLADESFRWGLFRTGNLVFTEQMIDVPAGTQANPGTAEFNVTVRTPATADTGTSKFNVVAQSNNAPRVVSVAKVVVGGFSVTATGSDFFSLILGGITGFLTHEFAFPKPFFGLAGLTGLHIALLMTAIGFLVFYVSGLQWIRKKASNSR